jgi:glycosyltransferase involved in cell wall biosynthesis
MHDNIREPNEVLKLHKEGHGYLDRIKNYLEIAVIEHINYEGIQIKDKVPFYFFKGRKEYWWLPVKTNRFVKKQQPDIVLVQGLLFPIQVIFLRLLLGSGSKIIVQHHGEQPPVDPIKKYFQKLADKFIDAYFFTSLGNAQPWADAQSIGSVKKCYEVLEASTFFTRQDKTLSKNRTGITGSHNFLWVGRLNLNKDPITVLKGFENYCITNSAAKLYMIFQTEELLDDVKQYVEQSAILSKSVCLLGRIPHEELVFWFSASDFYLSGSHREGSGFALLEAMACGCIPFVTNIPSFKKITHNGDYGILYEPGNAEGLSACLRSFNYSEANIISDKITKYFHDHLSFDAIAKNIFNICSQLER